MLTSNTVTKVNPCCILRICGIRVVGYRFCTTNLLMKQKFLMKRIFETRSCPLRVSLGLPNQQDIELPLSSRFNRNWNLKSFRIILLRIGLHLDKNVQISLTDWEGVKCIRMQSSRDPWWSSAGFRDNFSSKSATVWSIIDIWYRAILSGIQDPWGDISMDNHVITSNSRRSGIKVEW